MNNSSTNQAIFRCLHMSGTADQPDHVPSNAIESLFRASAHIVAVFRAVLSSNAKIAFDTVPQ